MVNNCVFCDIVAGKSPANFVFKGHGTIGIVPLNPVTDGHVIFIPEIHVADLSTIPLVTGKVAELASKWWASSNDGPVNMITSKGREATQSVFHLHIHLVPRRKGDGLTLPWHSGGDDH